MKNQFISIFNSIFLEGLEKFGRYYSVYRGFVHSNEDPLFLNRLQLRIPNIIGNSPMEYWSLPSNNFSGENYGCQVLPQKGDLVWVEFELGNPKRPLWKHGYFGTSDTKEKELQDYKNYWFKTPNGNLIELSDSGELIRFTSAKGKVIEISDKISLGKKDESDEPAVMGIKNAELWAKLLEALEKVTTSTMLGPQPFINQAEFTALKQLVEGTKSKNVTLIK